MEEINKNKSYGFIFFFSLGRQRHDDHLQRPHGAPPTYDEALITGIPVPDHGFVCHFDIFLFLYAIYFVILYNSFNILNLTLVVIAV